MRATGLNISEPRHTLEGDGTFAEPAQRIFTFPTRRSRCPISATVDVVGAGISGAIDLVSSDDDDEDDSD